VPGTIDRLDVTGLVLAGGRGTRMGSVDKGLVPYCGKPMAQHAVERLAPQVGGMLVNANRHLDCYEALGFTVCPDLLTDFPGPLAGLQAGLSRCVTPYLATVPCDSPLFPFDLVERLGDALREADAEIAVVQTTEEGRAQAQPVFLLMATGLRSSLDRFLLEGGRKIDRWAAGHRRVDVPFEDAAAFVNANSPDDLARLERRLD
jgi:molybdopterin-guanine dinucleotide biosynthesis protein A